MKTVNGKIPKIVAVGGGTGLAVLLKGLKKYDVDLTAIVTVSDDGGSSGRLRCDLGILPPGDIRKCLVALAGSETLMEELLQYRFSSGELAGHSLGNLILVALSDIAGGFDLGVKALAEVLAVKGQVLPATLENTVLGAEKENGTIIWGQSKIYNCPGSVKKVFLKPEEVKSLPQAIEAIKAADMIVLGPGSLYTSIIPILLVKGFSDAFTASRAVKIYVCNVMTQPGETDGYTAADHASAILNHAGRVCDYVLINALVCGPRDSDEKALQPVKPCLDGIKSLNLCPVLADLSWDGKKMLHHPEKLARAVLELLHIDRSWV